MYSYGLSCMTYQKSNINRHTKSNFSKFQPPSEKLRDVDNDPIGSLPPLNVNIYYLTCTERYTNWMEVIPLNNISTDIVSKIFCDNWNFRSGTSYRLITDRSAELRSELLSARTKVCGIKLQQKAAYHHQANGNVE